jgi:NADPH-dependent glutamate synthase beta subunit-like oxidoreductase
VFELRYVFTSSSFLIYVIFNLKKEDILSRLNIVTQSKAQAVVEELYKDLERRIVASPPGLCPIDMSASFLKLCHAQTCGKCVPCRVGLGQLANMLDDVLNGNATLETLESIERTAHVIVQTADCAIGYEAANMVLKGINGFRDDYISHISNGQCQAHLEQPVPCVALCPAGVDIPGYIALVAEGRYADSVRLIRKDNPFPTACALVCEHPCEARCRRSIVDDAINIRGLKRVAVDHSANVPVPANAPSTGKKIAIIGGGPSGLSAAYYLQLMGHQTTVFEQRQYLGGMLLYGIPNYRLPKERLADDINAILSTGVEVKLNTSVGNHDGQIPFEKIREEYDAVYIAIGAHTDKKLGIEGENAEGVMSAVELLRNIGDKNIPDFTGKRVLVVGGGNVAMDVTRSSIRLGAQSTTVLYRRRKADMTALPEEVEGAIAEGAEILELHAPSRIETDENGHVVAMWADPKMTGLISRGRPSPADSGKEPVRIPCDIVIVAIGQDIVADPFEQAGLPVKRNQLLTDDSAEIRGIRGVFSGGDCVTGPATVIKAIATGKVAAANIDNYLGYNHIITADVEIPPAKSYDRPACGRVTMTERPAEERKKDFNLMENCMSDKEACQESRRCLRCDRFGYGVFKGGRTIEW